MSDLPNSTGLIQHEKNGFRIQQTRKEIGKISLKWEVQYAIERRINYKVYRFQRNSKSYMKVVNLER